MTEFYSVVLFYPAQKASAKYVHNFVGYFADTQTDRRTERFENITSLTAVRKKTADKLGKVR